jgi:hypothetical protein
MTPNFSDLAAQRIRAEPYDQVVVGREGVHGSGVYATTSIDGNQRAIPRGRHNFARRSYQLFSGKLRLLGQDRG